MRQLLSEPLLAALEAAVEASGFERSTVGDPTLETARGHGPASGGTSKGFSSGHRQIDERRTSRSVWLHGYNDPRQSHSAARAVQRRVASALRLRSERLRRGVEPLLAVEYVDRHRLPSIATDTLLLGSELPLRCL